MTNRKQLDIFLILLALYAFSAFVTYAFFVDQLAASAGVPVPDTGVSDSVLGLANAGVIFVLYGLLGLLGYWFARKLDLPGIFSEDGNWRRWFFIPLVIGLICGVAVVLVDVLFAPVNGYGRIAHPPFPISVFASISAGVGEEIAFRGLVFGLWGFIFSWALKRFSGRTIALWIANIIAALAFAASHFGTLLFLTHASSFAELNPVFIVEVFLINSIVGLVAGERYMKDGLVAAAGVHFWTDVVFHVIWGLF